MAVEEDVFRALFGSLPAVVAVVTAADAAGRPYGFTSSTVCAVSKSPPLLLVCVDKDSRTLPVLRRAGAFAVNFLAEDGEQLSERFAGRGPDKFSGVGWRPSPYAGGAPLLTDRTAARAECVVHREIPAGDHRLFLGRIEAASLSDRSTLIYHRRAYQAWPPPVHLPARTGRFD
ncbi:flavin reductase (DIM6/NTAB) family NADH-FMN oxidoreductase RutF [Kitasatospora sp. MAA4]|uniref:flavin reductase family protein n=1 Tax=Kitasatospora sp. MAA4 TaxID=3035093 RepID=UPI002474176D|nr:flavin reductase family protein [Kitasatospora sp. MAA4]MDH6132392.1 flavin reductase (DIM6/NTAB) family NADH-FMN oxidoreductase RutF [Kitasatospora sp. MAA4]